MGVLCLLNLSLAVLDMLYPNNQDNLTQVRLVCFVLLRDSYLLCGAGDRDVSA